MKRYLFKKRNLLFETVFVVAAILWLGYSFHTGIIFYIGLTILLLQAFFTIEEIQITDNQIAIKNAFKQTFHFNYRDICVFGKGWGNSVFYIFGVKKGCLPFMFQSLGELPDKVPEILNTLEQLSGKKKGVLYFKRQ